MKLNCKHIINKKRGWDITQTSFFVSLQKLIGILPITNEKWRVLIDYCMRVILGNEVRPSVTTTDFVFFFSTGT